MLRLIVILVLSLSPLTAKSESDLCKRWFAKSKIKRGPNCLTECARHRVDMQTFVCTSHCETLCKPDSKIIGRLLYYPGLTVNERSLVTAHPSEAIEVFFLKEKAEKAAMKRFGRDDSGDESDAFRHFLWAGLVYEKLGPELAKKFLDAHESELKDDDPDRAMDLANNRAGLIAAERLRSQKQLNQENLEIEALRSLKENTLVILKRKGGPK